MNLLNLKENSDRLVIIAKGFLKLWNLHMLLKRKNSSLPRNLALGTSGELLIVFSRKINLIYLLYTTAQRCCLPHLIKQNCSLKTFLINNLDDSGISLSVFPSEFNLKLHNISVTLKIVKKCCNEPWFIKGVRSWLYSSGGSKELWASTFIHTSWSLQYIFERVLFFILLKGLIGGFVFKNVVEKSAAKNCRPISFFAVVSKVIENL